MTSRKTTSRAVQQIRDEVAAECGSGWLAETVRWELSWECVFLALGFVLRAVLATQES